MNNESISSDLIVLAVVGMPATGKSEVIKKLKDKYGFFHLYYGDVTFDEIKKRGLEINEKNERIVREELRSGGDLAIYSKLILPKIEEAIKKGEKRILLESMYNIYEYEVIKNKFPESFKVLAIHSNEDIRIKRINERKERPLTMEELKSRQVSEAKNLGKGTVISFADFHFLNNGSNMQVFEQDLDQYLRKFIFRIPQEKHTKDFNEWNENKKATNLLERIKVKPGQIYWARLGLNIGFEQDGKGENYRRPILIIKKFSAEIILGIPLSTKIKEGSWYKNFVFQGVKRVLILSQAKVFDVKRFDQYEGQISENELRSIFQDYIKFLQK
jgi:mRNA interferase MazF